MDFALLRQVSHGFLRQVSYGITWHHMARYHMVSYDRYPKLKPYVVNSRYLAMNSYPYLFKAIHSYP